MHDERTARRFWAKVDRRGPDECWEWTGATTGSGYAQMRIGAHASGVHRLSYEMNVGPIPDGLTIDHLCRNKLCVNPAHLEPVTNRTNTMRCPDAPATRNAAKTHCPRGHAYAPPHLYVSRAGKRHCLTCIRERKAERRRAAGVPQRKKRPAP